MASKGMWKKEFRAGRWKIAAGLLILGLTAISIPLFFDYTVKLMDLMSIPEFAKNQAALMKDFRFFVWYQWFGKNLSQIGALLAAIFGSGLVSSEVTRNTIQFLLSKPVSRETVFTVKYVVNLVNIALITVLSSLVLYVALLAANRTYPVVQMIEQVVLAVAGLSVVYSLAVFFSTIFDQSMKSALASICAVIVLYLQSWIPSIGKYSLFYQMSGSGIYSGQGFPVVTMVVLGGISAALYYLGRRRFVSRDF